MDINERRQVSGIVRELSKLKKQSENLEKVINNETDYFIFTEKLRMIKDQLKRLAAL